MKCPNCESENMVIVTTTSIQNEILSGGRMGPAILDEEGISYLEDCVSFDSEDVEFKCRDCHKSFKAIPGDMDCSWTIGDEI